MERLPKNESNLLNFGKMRLCVGIDSQVKMGIRADRLCLLKQDYWVKFCKSF